MCEVHDVHMVVVRKLLERVEHLHLLVVLHERLRNDGMLVFVAYITAFLIGHPGFVHQFIEQKVLYLR